jgi:hypothetical protein
MLSFCVSPDAGNPPTQARCHIVERAEFKQFFDFFDKKSRILSEKRDSSAAPDPISRIAALHSMAYHALGPPLGAGRLYCLAGVAILGQPDGTGRCYPFSHSSHPSRRTAQSAAKPTLDAAARDELRRGSERIDGPVSSRRVGAGNENAAMRSTRLGSPLSIKRHENRCLPAIVKPLDDVSRVQ